MDLLELQNKRGELVTQMREINDRSTNTSEHDGFANADDRSQYTKIEADLKAIENTIARTKAIEEADRQAAEIDFKREKQEETTKGSQQVYDRGFDKWLRFNDRAMTAEEQAIFKTVQSKGKSEDRAQGTGSDAAGGALISRDLHNEIDKALKAFGGVYAIARHLNTGKGNTLDYPTNNDTANKSTIIAESTDIGDGTDLVFGKVTLNSYKLTTGWIKLPFELIEDTEFDIAAFVAEAIAERDARGLATYLTTGTGSGQPQGVVTGAAAGVASASISAVTFDNVIDLLHSIDPAYRSAPNFRFMFNDAILAILRKLKDDEGRYIWSLGDVRTDAPDTLLGKKIVYNQDMASALAANARIMLAGDFSKYLVRNVGSPRLVRTDELFKGSDQVAYTYFSRVEGKILNSAAIKRMTCPAS